MKLMDAARQVKHRSFLVRKRLRWQRKKADRWVADRYWAAAERRRPFEYVPQYYAHTFLSRYSPESGQVLPAPPILWAFWLGDRPLTPARKASISALRGQKDLDFRLITHPGEVLLPGHVLHPAFSYLASIHKSDYLRAYVMHHYGGVYVDVKVFGSQLRPVLDRLNLDDNSWVAAYREVTSEYVPELGYALGHLIKRHYRAAMGPSGFAFRPKSVFTAEWMRELDARMDYFSGALMDADAGDCDPYDRPPEYPIRWSEILADIIQPLSMKHQQHVLFSDEIRPALKGYR